MYRIYDVKRGLFKSRSYWSKTGRVWARKCDIASTIHYKKLLLEDTNIQVWQYADDGTLTKHTTIQAFLDHKPVRVKPVFSIYFIDGKMMQNTQWLDYYKRNGKTVMEIPSTEIVKEDLVLISTETRSRGLGATFSDGTIHYVMLPKHFREVLKKLNNGMLSGPFEFVNHSGYPGIKQIEKR